MCPSKHRLLAGLGVGRVCFAPMMWEGRGGTFAKPLVSGRLGASSADSWWARAWGLTVAGWGQPALPSLSAVFSLMGPAHPFGDAEVATRAPEFAFLDAAASFSADAVSFYASAAAAEGEKGAAQAKKGTAGLTEGSASWLTGGAGDVGVG
jgi:hypothetical protein